MQYWAFLANPSTYDVEGAIRELQTDDWLTDGKGLKPGDKAIIWKAKGRDEHRGVVALAEVLSEPFVADDSANPFWRRVTELAGPRERVTIRYQKFPELPLWLNSSNEFLNDLSVAKARGGTVFYVTPEQWNAVMGRLTQKAEAEPEPVIEAAIRPTAHIGQSYLADSACRRAIELRAMELAREFYQGQWPEVFDVSATASCDLHCRAGEAQLRVEVKGTAGNAEHILLTSNEVLLARRYHPQTALFVVSQIEVDRSVVPPVGRGGTVCEIRPWFPDADRLAATAYRYRLSAV